MVTGTIMTLAGGILWGVSGVCGQYMFQNKGVTAPWLVSGPSGGSRTSDAVSLLFHGQRTDIKNMENANGTGVMLLFMACWE